MTGLGVLLARELLEIRRTWRVWVVPGMLAFFAVAGPLLALLTPRLLASIAATQSGVVIRIPDPTAIDAYAQFLKGLSQMVTFALIIGGAGLVNGERTSGTAMLVLTKPVSRAAFVLAKLAAELALLVVATCLATVVTLLVTRLVFPPAPVAPLASAVALWLVQAGVIVSAVLLFSVVFRSRGAAAGAGLAFFFLLLLLGIWPLAERYSFVGLSGAMTATLLGRSPSVVIPVATALGAIGALAIGAVMVFGRKEI